MTHEIATIVVAGGNGLRFGARKQFVEIGGRSVLQRSVDAALTVSKHVVVVVPPDALHDHGVDPVEGLLVVAGGDSRAASVRLGLQAVPDTVDFVLVHDAARPLASPALFRSVVDALRAGASAVVPVVPIADTVRHVDGHVVDRSMLRGVQTPQGFLRSVLEDAHASGTDATDDASLVEAIGGRVETIDGAITNRKITDPLDIDIAAALLGRNEPG